MLLNTIFIICIYLSIYISIYICENNNQNLRGNKCMNITVKTGINMITNINLNVSLNRTYEMKNIHKYKNKIYSDNKECIIYYEDYVKQFHNNISFIDYLEYWIIDQETLDELTDKVCNYIFIKYIK